MKNLFSFFLLALFALSATAQTNNFKRYADKSGRIDYTWTGKMTGTEVLIWDNWGENEKRISHTSTTIFGMTEESNTTLIRVGLQVYSWKDGEKKGTKHKDEAFETMAENVKDWDEFGKETMQQLGYEQQGTTSVDGKTCQLWKGMLGTIAIYKTYALKTESNVMGIKSTQLVSNYAAGKAVSASEFSIPADITFREVDLDNPEQMNTETDDTENTEEDVPNMKDAKKLLNGIINGL